MNNLDLLGKWPVDGKESRKKPVHSLLVPNGGMLPVLWSEKNPVLLRFVVSNDHVHLAEMFLPTGGISPRYSEPHKHAGDEVVFICKGSLCVFLPETKEAFEVKEEEAMLIPEGTLHQYINYTDDSVKALITLAPGL